MNPSKLRVFTNTTHRALLLTVLSLAGCSASAPGGSADAMVASTGEALLATACDTSGGNLALTVGTGDVAYIGRVAGCTVEPCVFANAKDASGNLCTVSSVGKTITVTGDGTPAHVEKVVFDFSNGLFAVATATPLMAVSLDGTGATSASKVMIIPPTTGGAMALGVNGLDINASSKRTAQHLDMTIAGISTDPAPKFEFAGGVASDSFTGDVANLPTGFATTAALTAVVGAATTLNLTISGGAGADFLAGGAGTNTLLGGAGNDTFVEGTALHAETIQGGDGVDTVDYSGRTLAVDVTPNSDTGVTSATVTSGTAGTGYVVGDILKLAGGTSGLPATLMVATVATGAVATVTVVDPGDGYGATGTAVASTKVTGAGSGATFAYVGAAANDGQVYQPAGAGSAVPAEGDSVASDVEIISGSSAADILNAHAVAATDVVLLGNAGDDKLIGGAGNDDLCGGAGNDTFYENAGNDNLVGGAGVDTADYSTGTAVVACLGSADTAAGKTCVAQNGGTFSGTAELDVVNNAALTKVCPRALLTVALAAGGTAPVAPTTPGGPMTADVENMTGNPTAANTLRCGTLACTVFGSTAADTIVGSPLGDQIFGLGGSDTVTANGGIDLLDLTGSSGATDTVDCGGQPVTILLGASPTYTPTNCASANIP